jgi:UDP-N-acetylmuramate dehydrogenase
MSVSLRHDVDLSPLNTLRLPARAAAYAEVTQAGQLPEFCRLSAAAGLSRRLVLGGGSNLALTQDFDGLVLRMAITGRELVGEDDDARYVAAGAGENWHDFVMWTIAQGWGGLENLALIPGTVGAAPIQNIGAYGVEVGERLHAVHTVDLDAAGPDGAMPEDVVFDLPSCRLGYRDSVWKQEGWHRSGRFAIVAVLFRLPKRWAPVTGYADLRDELEARKVTDPDPRALAEAVIAVRQRKLPDPAVLPNAGSFFQNPVVDLITATKLSLRYPKLPRYPQPDGRVKLAAGWMIEQAGWKGRDFGPVGMYEKQALVLVNREPGIARGVDVGQLAEAVRADVRRMFGVLLTPEPIFI